MLLQLHIQGIRKPVIYLCFAFVSVVVFFMLAFSVRFMTFGV